MTRTALLPDARALGAALLTAFMSAPGQTFFIAAFTLPMATSVGVSLAELGGAYMIATLAAGFALPLTGPWIDRVDLRIYLPAGLTGLALACVVTASAMSLPMLIAGLFLLRLTGQGLMPHIAMTATARYFTARRGRALAVVGLGLPLAEAITPGLGAVLIEQAGWREAYLIVAAAIVAIVMPGLFLMLRRLDTFSRPHPLSRSDGSVIAAARLLFSSPYFWLIAPIVVYLPFASTALIFHIAPIMEVRGWAPLLLGPGFLGFALGHVAALAVTGPLIDRVGAARLLPVMNWGPALGLVFLAASDSTLALFGFLALTGVGAGTVQPTVAAMWAEVYGTQRMGSIRSLAVMIMVAGTAAGPLTLGLALDAAVSPAVIALTLLAALLASSALALASLTVLRRTQERAGAL